ncbi:snare associated Golgi protein-domain-containing protein [Mycena sp. CBHHK59/15]|nr:snare associated Golgi protein-domain-containing protein [Mycena sp. CBHHK59/15]
MSLAPPPRTRDRASSTSRSLSLCTLDHPPPSPMLYLVASRILDWTHLNPRHGPKTLTRSPALCNHRTLPFPHHDPKPPPQSHHWFPSVSFPPSSCISSHPMQAHVPMLLVMLLLPLSTALVLLCLATLPITVSWPNTLTDLAQLGRELHGYSQSGPAQMAHVIGVMAITAIWKHAWSVPGSVIWNVLAGALFSPAFATILLTSLTTIGSACATLLAMPLGPSLRGDSDPKSSPSSEVTSDRPRSSAWVRLSVLRLIGVVPWSGINIACGVCGVSIWDCMLGAFIGSLPWTAVTCQIGDILQTVASHPSPTPQTVSSLLTSPAIITKLVVLSFLSLAPILGRERLRALITHEPIQPSTTEEKQRATRWAVAWVQDWRTKIRMASRSRTREQSQHELNVLVQEKRAIEDLSS